MGRYVKASLFENLCLHSTCLNHHPHECNTAFGFNESLRLELKKLGKTGVKTTCVCPYFINTGMFEVSLYVDRCLSGTAHLSMCIFWLRGIQGVTTRFSWILPILEPSYVTEQMLRSIKQNQDVLSMPVIVYLVPLLRGLLPTSLFDFQLDFLGVC